MQGIHGLSLSYAAGAVGGVVCCILIWFSGEIGFAKEYGINIHPQLTPAYMYPKLVWGGLWGLAFSLPLFERYVVLRGLPLSLLPTLFQLFVVYPIFENQGIMGAKLGEFTPLFVLAVNAAWGLTAGLWLRFAR